jgi:hypothetical protein
MREKGWRICDCSACEVQLLSPFPNGVEDGFASFTRELAIALCADEGEISDSDVARAWARAFGWIEDDDGWYCPLHKPRTNG